jgi:hypothetical protein
MRSLNISNEIILPAALWPGGRQPIIEAARNLPGVTGSQQVCKADSLTAVCEWSVSKMWEPQDLTTLWVYMVCYRNRFTPFFFVILHEISFSKTKVLLFMISPNI